MIFIRTRSERVLNEAISECKLEGNAPFNPSYSSALVAVFTSALGSAGFVSAGLASAGLTSVAFTSAGFGSAAFTSAGLTPAGLTSAAFTSTGLTSAGFTSVAFTSAGLTSVGFVSAGLASAGLTSVAFTSAGLTSAGFVSAGLVSAGLTSAGLTSAGFGSATGLGSVTFISTFSGTAGASVRALYAPSISVDASLRRSRTGLPGGKNIPMACCSCAKGPVMASPSFSTASSTFSLSPSATACRISTAALASANVPSIPATLPLNSSRTASLARISASIEALASTIV
ncbi:MAG: hypothetical protein HQ542_07060 [Bacteroidia bacterium]|nr:hypothetical protein [Bacteroidia bacterium]